MAKGSVRKKGKKWYYRFYVEDASGNSVQREFPGSESKSETEAMLRKAMADYEEKQFVAKSENLTLAGSLDKWIEEELKPGSLSNGTVAAYIDTARRIKKHPIADRKLKKITPDHSQSYLDLLSLGGEWPDGTVRSAERWLHAAILRCLQGVPASRCSRSSTSPSTPCSTSCTARGRRIMTCFRRTERMRMFQLSRRSPTNSFLN